METFINLVNVSIRNIHLSFWISSMELMLFDMFIFLFFYYSESSISVKVVISVAKILNQK